MFSPIEKNPLPEFYECTLGIDGESLSSLLWDGTFGIERLITKLKTAEGISTYY